MSGSEYQLLLPFLKINTWLLFFNLYATDDIAGDPLNKGWGESVYQIRSLLFPWVSTIAEFKGGKMLIYDPIHYPVLRLLMHIHKIEVPSIVLSWPLSWQNLVRYLIVWILSVLIIGGFFVAFTFAMLSSAT